MIVTVLWAYILYRAVFIGITQDESYSYFLVKTNYWRAMPGSLNTHWLNTLAMKLFLWLPGPDHLWKLRILSVLSWWLYSYSAIKLSAQFKHKLIGFTFFLAAVLNPFLIFFFSLGRGYAVACAFLLFSISQAYRTIYNRAIDPVSWMKVFLPASIAVLANFSSFYFFIGITVVYIFHLLANKKTSVLFDPSAYSWKFLITGTSLFAAFSLLFIRYHTKEFEGSESSDLIDSLFGSQIRYGSHLTTGMNVFPLGLILFMIMIILTIISCNQYFKSKTMTVGIFTILVSGVIILCSILFYLVFRTPFLYGRTGLIFYVTLLPGFFGIVDSWEPGRKSAGIGLQFLMIFIGVIYLFNFYKGFYLNYFYEWPVQTDTQRSLDYVQRVNARQVGLTSWHFSVFNHYYSRAYPEKYSFHSIIIDEKKIPNPDIDKCDYLIVTIPDSGKNTLTNNLNIIWTDSATRTMILSKR
jgi:hypothetical protein